ncbi:MAG: sugar phosphate isomerase/epimerase family protein [Planctomycetaceae bacterium]
MIPCLSQVCTLGATVEEDLDGYADGACTAVELWLTKVEEYLATGRTAAELLQRAADRGLTLACAAFQGGLLMGREEARGEVLDQFERRLDLLAALGVPVLVVTPDFLGPFSQADLERAAAGLAEAGERARSRRVRLALEFQARGTFLTNIETAVAFTQSIGHRNVGICLDAFHYAVGPSKSEDLGWLTRENLFHVQLSDVADRPRELATDADRILPGEGDFPLAPLVNHLRSIGYDGCVSLELLNPQFWPIAPQQFGEIGLTALRMALGQASGGTVPARKGERAG